MIQERIAQLELALRTTSTLPLTTQTELLRLIGELKTEVAAVQESHNEDAQSITRFTDASLHEAMRADRKPELSAAALKGLTSSVVGLEASHPVLAQIVNRIAMALSNMGI